MIILKSTNFAINCTKVLKITQNDKTIPAEYRFNWLGKPFVSIKYKPLYEINSSFEEWKCTYGDGQQALKDLAAVIKQIIKQDPEMAWLDRAAEEGLLGET